MISGGNDDKKKVKLHSSNWKKTTHASEKRVPPRSRARRIFNTTDM